MILLGITIMFYYLIKGVSVKETNALLVITLIAWVLNLLILISIEGGIIKLFASIYLIFSFIDYLSISFTGKQIYELPWMSGIRVKNKEVYVNYQIFRPITVGLINLFLFFKRGPMIGMNETIEVNVNSKDGTKVDIKL